MPDSIAVHAIRAEDRQRTPINIVINIVDYHRNGPPPATVSPLWAERALVASEPQHEYGRRATSGSRA